MKTIGPYLLRIETIAGELGHKLVKAPEYDATYDSIKLQFEDRWLELDLEPIIAAPNHWEDFVRFAIRSQFEKEPS